MKKKIISISLCVKSFLFTLPLKRLASVRFVMFFHDESLLLIKAVFIRSKIQKILILCNIIAISGRVWALNLTVPLRISGSGL